VIKKWSLIELEYLKNNYSIKTNRELQKFLKRSFRGINFKASQLQLKKDYETYCSSRKHTNVNISKELMERLYLNEGKSIRKIAKEYNLGKNTILHYLNKYKIKRRNTSQANKNFYSLGGKIWAEGLTKETDKRLFLSFQKLKETWLNKYKVKLRKIEEIHGDKIDLIIKDLYWNKGLNQEQIARRIGLSRKNIIDLMKEFSISKRPNFEIISNLRGVKHSQYGKKWEDIYGIEGARKMKENRSINSRKLIIKRLANREMPFVDTRIERLMAEAIKKEGLLFIGQYEIDNKFVCDFASPKFKLIVECDGDYWHANPMIYNHEKLDNRQKANVQRDKYKDKYLQSKGWRVLRFFESDILASPEKCIKEIKSSISSK